MLVIKGGLVRDIHESKLAAYEKEGFKPLMQNSYTEPKGYIEQEEEAPKKK